MILIIGGAHMGKLEYAKSEYGVADESIFDLSGGLPSRPFPVLSGLECFTRRCAGNGMAAEETIALLEPLIGENTVVTACEIGCGIVPADPAERAYRELHGRVLGMLAARSEHVIRVFCGIAEVLK